MQIDRYSFKQTAEYPNEHVTGLKELQAEFPQLSKQTVKDWVLSGANIKSGKIVIYKKQEECN